MKRLALALLVTLSLAPTALAADAPPSDPVAVATWEARDFEGRWALVAAGGAGEDEWAAFLSARREWDVLEWIALTTRTSDATDALAKADAPGWMRCAVWRLRVSDSHGFGNARGLLTKRAGAFLAWLARFPKAETGPAADLAKTLRAEPPPKEDVSALLPPLDPAEVFRHLAPPERVEDWGDATRAKPGVVYAHQVERAIRALMVSDFRGEPWLSRLAALLRHSKPSLRRNAALAFAHVPAEFVPMDALLALEGDAREPADVRSAALIGASYAKHPKAYVRLCDVALDPAHPAWRAAVSRLGDESDEFTLAQWKAVRALAPGGEPATFAEQQEQRVRKALASADADGSALPSRVPRLLERAAWAALVDDPLRATIVPFVRDLLAQHASEAGVRAVLERTVAAIGPTNPPSVVPAPTLNDHVSALAQQALGTPKPPK